MKKKALTVVLIFVLLALLVALVACGEKASDRIYSAAYVENDQYEIVGLSPDGYKAGDRVSFTVEVKNADMQLDEVKVLDTVLNQQPDGHFEFNMPAIDVAINVTLKLKSPTVSLEIGELRLNLLGESVATVTAVVLPSSDAHELEWQVRDESVATVAANGKNAVVTAVAKGNTLLVVMLKDGDVELSRYSVPVYVDNVRAWTKNEEDLMKEHLYGEVLEPTSNAEMRVTWDEIPSEGIAQITISGGWVEGDELADYAAKYTKAKGWYDMTDRYVVSQGTAYIYEKQVETEDGARYLRVFIYAETEDFEETTEGLFYITCYDPYVYEWPEDYVEAVIESFLSNASIPSVEAQHYYVSSSYSAYSVTAYFESDKVDGGYGELLSDAGWQIEKVEGTAGVPYYVALSPDSMMSVMFIYVDGALEITMTYPTLTVWPRNTIEKYFNLYAEQGATYFEIPVFEGDGVTFTFGDGLYNRYHLDDPNYYPELNGILYCSDSTQEQYTAYLAKLMNDGWSEIDAESGIYQKKIGDLSAKITVTYSSSYSRTEIVIYYLLRSTSNEWIAQDVADALGKYVTDVIPAYEGSIVNFSVEGDTIYVTVPKEDFAALQENYVETLLANGYEQTGNPDQIWTIRYVSPNGQIKLTLNTRVSDRSNTMSIVFDEVPGGWNLARALDYLSQIGASISTLPEPQITDGQTYSYDLSASTLIIDVLNKDYYSYQKSDIQAYKEALIATGEWEELENSTEAVAKLVADDGTTVWIYISNMGHFLIEFTSAQ